jgi:trimeric autotransporter adhesin
VLRIGSRLLVVSSLVFFILMTGCGGGSGSSKSSQPPPTGPTPNPAPTIASITPSSLVAGTSSQTLTVTGSGFISSSVINLNTTALSTTYVSSTSLQATVPASAIAADGTIRISVTNPSPGGGTSQEQSYAITVPTAAITGISPQSVSQGVAAVVTISGTGFEANSKVQWNGSDRPTTFVNATTIQVALTAADVQNFGIGQLSVTNPGFAPTTPLDLYVLANTPTILGISPNSIAVITGSNVPQQVYIYGSGFASNATVQANGKPVSVISQTATNITASLDVSYFAAPGTISIAVSNPGSPVISSNTMTITVTGPTAPSFTLNPNSAPAGSSDTTITLQGTGFYQDSAVYWNNTKLSTTYVNSSQVTAVIPASLLTGFAQASISVSTPENSQAAAPQPFNTFLELPVNDIVYNTKDSLIYASIPGYAGENLGNSIGAIDPTTGVLQKTIFVGSEPNRLALSDDGTQLFVGLDGAAAVRQVNLTTGTAGIQFSLGGSSVIYNPPYTAVGLAVLPGQPNSVAVSSSSGIITIFDSGVARSNTSASLNNYFGFAGALAFGSPASTLYVSTGSLYKLTIDATGVTAATQLQGNNLSRNSLQYDNGKLYTPSGLVFDATSGAQIGQFSTTGLVSTNPAPAAGAIISDSTLNRAWIVPYNYGSANQLLSFDETTYDPVASIPVTGIGSIPSTAYSTNPADLIRWGQNGLAFHTPNQLYVLQGPIVKDNSTSPADLSVTVQAAATATTGTALTYTVKVQNLGPNTAQGVTLQDFLPGSAIVGSISTTQGSCNGSGVFYCDLASITSGSSATVTVTVTPSVSGTIETTAMVSSVSYDPVSTNNQASASTTVSGSLFSPPPVITQLSPALIQAGSNSFVLTVNGEGFTTASTVLWNGQTLPTTLLSSGQLTAAIDSSLVKQLGWANVSVSTVAPGGGQSTAIPFSIYQLLNVSANAIKFDPFTQKLYAVLPSTSTNLSGNSIVPIDPFSVTIGTPIQVGSEPNLLSETSDGNYFYIGLNGAKSLGRFNLRTQSPDLTVPIPDNSVFGSGQISAIAIATIPGSDTSLAVESSSFNGNGIFDISGSTGTFRKNSTFSYQGDNPVFSDPTHFYSSSANVFSRYGVDANGATLIDQTTVNGFGGFGGPFAVDGGLAYGTSGGIIDPTTTTPTQLGVLPLGSGPYQTGLVGGGVVPYAAESKSFNIGVNIAGIALTYLERFDTQHFTLEQTIQFPTSNNSTVVGTRWGQDGLAYIIPGPWPSNSQQAQQQQQLFLIRGPFVLPAEGVSNPAPALTGTDHNTITAGSGNFYLTVTGSGFLPGATVLWNGSAHTTNYVDSTHLSVAIPASDVKTAATITLSCQNPGSDPSNTLSINVQ